MRYRLVSDALAPRYPKGSTVDFGPSVWRRACESTGVRPWECSMPEDVGGPGSHYLERTWPEPVEVALELGPEPILEPLSPEEESEHRAALADAQNRLTAAQTGLREVEEKLAATLARARVVGLDQEGLSNRGLYAHHRRQWLAKVADAKGDVARALVLLEPVPAGVSVPSHVLLSGDGRPQQVPAAEFRDRLTAASVAVCQWPGLVDLVPVEGGGQALVRYGFPDPANVVWREFRDLLRCWAVATGRGVRTFRALVGDADVRELFERASAAVDAARSNAA